MIIFFIGRPFTPHKVTVQSIQQSQYLWSKLAGTFPLHSVYMQHLQTWWWKSEVASVANAGHRRVIQSERHARRRFGNAKWCALRCDAFKARHRLKWRRLGRLQEAEYKGIKVRGMTPSVAAASQFDAGKRSSCPHENEWQRTCKDASCLMFIPCWLVPGCCFTHSDPPPGSMRAQCVGDQQHTMYKMVNHNWIEIMFGLARLLDSVKVQCCCF